MEETQSSSAHARRNEDIALDLMKFVAMTTGYGRTTSSGVGFQGTGAASKPEEYAAQATALKEHGLGSSSLAPDIGVITAVKAISYRVIVSVSHIFVDYYWTGNYVAAGALEVLQITINSTKFYFHELAWAKYMGIPRTDSARTLDFKYIGVDV